MNFKNTELENKITLSQANLFHNLKFLREKIENQTRFGLVIKGNAYGHGINHILQLLHMIHLEDKKIDYLFFYSESDLNSCLNVFNNTNINFCSLTFPLPENISLYTYPNIVLAITRPEQLEIASSIAFTLKKKIKINLCFDINLGREGILENEINDVSNFIKSNTNLEIHLVSTHLSTPLLNQSDEKKYLTQTLHKFDQIVNSLKDLKITNFLTSVFSTYAVMSFLPQIINKYDIVRIGGGMYGLYPGNKEFSEYKLIKANLKPILSWHSYISELKEFATQQFIGYGRTYQTTQRIKTALIPQGYSDGYPRLASNSGEVLIKGYRCPVLGRVSMNCIIVDVTHLPNITTYEKVTLLGTQEQETIYIEDLADLALSNSYEIACNLNHNLKREII